MTAPEFSRVFGLRSLPVRPVTLEATPEERVALARRFDLVAVEAMGAEVRMTAQGATVHVTGRLRARVTQSCAISGEDLGSAIDEQLSLRFVPEQRVAQEEIELDADALDEVSYAGTIFDVGEAVAQSLALAIDPYAVGPEAERVRHEAGLGEQQASGPLAAALAALKKS